MTYLVEASSPGGLYNMKISSSLQRTFGIFSADLLKLATELLRHPANLYHYLQGQLDMSYALRNLPSNCETVILLNREFGYCLSAIHRRVFKW